MTNSALKKTKEKQSIVVNNVPIEWNEDGKGCTFFGLDAILFWTSPSLVSILAPLRAEIGDELYALIIGYEASKGTFEDYHSMVSTLGQSFEEGFLNWGRAVSTAGWGSFSILSLDFEGKEAVIQIDDPWEMRIFKAEHFQDSVPFLSGKISGIFSHAFQTNCRCSILEATNVPGKIRRAVLRVSPSTETLERALMEMNKNKNLPQQEQLRAANSAFRRNQQRLTDMLETIGERIWETDSTMSIRYVSDFEINDLDRSSQNVIGQSLLDFLHADDIEPFRQACEQLRVGQIAVAEIKARYKAGPGTYYWGHYRFKAVLDISGKHEGYLGSVRDVTKEFELQKQLMEQQERTLHASKMASLGEVAAGIAHEINNPLTEIVGNIWHLKSRQKQNSLEPAEVSAALDVIDKMSKRIAEIIKGMRSFSRDAGQDAFVSVSIQTILDDTLVFCRRRFSSQGIDLKVSLSNPSLELNCRAIQISQVLLNLLNNAYDAVVPLKDKWIQVNITREQKWICIEVIDSGKGLSASLASKIMQPFFTTKEPGKGTGLGLSISRGIIESHGGELSLDREFPHTKFVIRLPAGGPDSLSS
jgi:PAS domain S-box-containing protein